jgi:hypothetical protein
MEMIYSFLMTVGLLTLGAAIAFVVITVWMWWMSQ